MYNSKKSNLFEFMCKKVLKVGNPCKWGRFLTFKISICTKPVSKGIENLFFTIMIFKYQVKKSDYYILLVGWRTSIIFMPFNNIINGLINSKSMSLIFKNILLQLQKFLLKIKLVPYLDICTVLNILAERTKIALIELVLYSFFLLKCHLSYSL